MSPLDMFHQHLQADTNVANAMKPVRRATALVDGVVTISLYHEDRARLAEELIVVKVIELSRYNATSISPTLRPDGLWVAHIAYFECDETYAHDTDATFGDDSDE